QAAPNSVAPAKMRKSAPRSLSPSALRDGITGGQLLASPYTGLRVSDDRARTQVCDRPDLLPYVCMYIISMRNPLADKLLSFEQTTADVRDTSRKIGTAAESQATLNIALTAVAVTALIVAALLVHDTRVNGHG
ncbi:hypothetical protein ACWGNA_28015, partial [Brucella cytisi]